MVSIPSAFMLFVLALVGATSSARTTESLSRALATWSPSEQEIGASDATPDAGWRHAVRAEGVRPARWLTGQRDANAERRERTSHADPAWISLQTLAAHASRIASSAPSEHRSGVRAPGLPAPSSRAPPLS